MSSYWGVVVLIAVALAGLGALFLVARALSPAPRPLVVLPFQSGWVPQEHALSRYHARWYPLALVFLAFDVEMLFMFPWAAVVARIGTEAIVEMFVFLGILVLGVIWAWREGSLRWV